MLFPSTLRASDHTSGRIKPIGHTCKNLQNNPNNQSTHEIIRTHPQSLANSIQGLFEGSAQLEACEAELSGPLQTHVPDASPGEVKVMNERAAWSVMEMTLFNNHNKFTLVGLVGI